MLADDGEGVEEERELSSSLPQPDRSIGSVSGSGSSSARPSPFQGTGVRPATVGAGLGVARGGRPSHQHRRHNASSVPVTYEASEAGSHSVGYSGLHHLSREHAFKTQAWIRAQVQHDRERNSGAYEALQQFMENSAPTSGVFPLAFDAWEKQLSFRANLLMQVLQESEGQMHMFCHAQGNLLGSIGRFLRSTLDLTQQFTTVCALLVYAMTEEEDALRSSVQGLASTVSCLDKESKLAEQERVQQLQRLTAAVEANQHARIVLTDRDWLRRNLASTTLQMAYRRHSVAKRCRFRCRTKAAMAIQRRFRGYRVRKHYGMAEREQLWKARFHAACTLQRRLSDLTKVKQHQRRQSQVVANAIAVIQRFMIHQHKRFLMRQAFRKHKAALVVRVHDEASVLQQRLAKLEAGLNDEFSELDRGTDEQHYLRALHDMRERVTVLETQHAMHRLAKQVRGRMSILQSSTEATMDQPTKPTPSISRRGSLRRPSTSASVSRRSSRSSSISEAVRPGTASPATNQSSPTHTRRSSRTMTRLSAARVRHEKRSGSAGVGAADGSAIGDGGTGAGALQDDRHNGLTGEGGDNDDEDAKRAEQERRRKFVLRRYDSLLPLEPLRVTIADVALKLVRRIRARKVVERQRSERQAVMAGAGGAGGESTLLRLRSAQSGRKPQQPSVEAMTKEQLAARQQIRDEQRALADSTAKEVMSRVLRTGIDAKRTSQLLQLWAKELQEKEEIKEAEAEAEAQAKTEAQVAAGAVSGAKEETGAEAGPGAGTEERKKDEEESMLSAMWRREVVMIISDPSSSGNTAAATTSTADAMKDGSTVGTACERPPSTAADRTTESVMPRITQGRPSTATDVGSVRPQPQPHTLLDAPAGSEGEGEGGVRPQTSHTPQPPGGGKRVPRRPNTSLARVAAWKRKVVYVKTDDIEVSQHLPSRPASFLSSLTPSTSVGSTDDASQPPDAAGQDVHNALEQQDREQPTPQEAQQQPSRQGDSKSETAEATPSSGPGARDIDHAAAEDEEESLLRSKLATAGADAKAMAALLVNRAKAQSAANEASVARRVAAAGVGSTTLIDKGDCHGDAAGDGEGDGDGEGGHGHFVRGSSATTPKAAVSEDSAKLLEKAGQALSITKRRTVWEVGRTRRQEVRRTAVGQSLLPHFNLSPADVSTKPRNLKWAAHVARMVLDRLTADLIREGILVPVNVDMPPVLPPVAVLLGDTAPMPGDLVALVTAAQCGISRLREVRRWHNYKGAFCCGVLNVEAPVLFRQAMLQVYADQARSTAAKWVSALSAHRMQWPLGQVMARTLDSTASPLLVFLLYFRLCVSTIVPGFSLVRDGPAAASADVMDASVTLAHAMRVVQYMYGVAQEHWVEAFVPVEEEDNDPGGKSKSKRGKGKGTKGKGSGKAKGKGKRKRGGKKGTGGAGGARGKRKRALQGVEETVNFAGLAESTAGGYACQWRPGAGNADTVPSSHAKSGGEGGDGGKDAGVSAFESGSVDSDRRNESFSLSLASESGLRGGGIPRCSIFDMVQKAIDLSYTHPAVKEAAAQARRKGILGATKKRGAAEDVPIPPQFVQDTSADGGTAVIEEDLEELTGGLHRAGAQASSAATGDGEFPAVAAPPPDAPCPPLPMRAAPGIHGRAKRLERRDTGAAASDASSSASSDSDSELESDASSTSSRSKSVAAGAEAASASSSSSSETEDGADMGRLRMAGLSMRLITVSDLFSILVKEHLNQSRRLRLAAWAAITFVQADPADSGVVSKRKFVDAWREADGVGPSQGWGAPVTARAANERRLVAAVFDDHIRETGEMEMNYREFFAGVWRLSGIVDRRLSQLPNWAAAATRARR